MRSVVEKKNDVAVCRSDNHSPPVVKQEETWEQENIGWKLPTMDELKEGPTSNGWG